MALDVELTSMRSYDMSKTSVYTTSCTRWEINTVELVWLEHLWNHENKFEAGIVRTNERQAKRHNRDIFSIFFDVTVCCLWYTHYTIFNFKNSP